MCGIVGYTGSESAAPRLIEGLKRLEYRGYDSAGIAVEQGGSLQIVRRRGKVLTRSEERRVGKECRSRWSPYH